MQPFRITPAGPVRAYQTYQITAPLATHWRTATCTEVDCDAHLRGWSTTVDVATELGARQATYIRMHAGRAYTVTEAGTLVTFMFPGGQQCFRTHRVPLGRPEIYTVRGGDWRGSTGLVRRHADAQDWVDDFGEHQEQLADRLARG